MEWQITEQEAWFLTRRFWYLVGAVVLAGALIVFSYPYVERLYDKVKAKNLAKRAATSCASGDYKSALLQAGKVLDIDRNNLSATRTVAKSLDAVGAPVAIQWHRRLDELQPGEAENLIAWAKGALQAGDVNTADSVLKRVKAADQNDAAWHEIAAGVALAKRDGEEATSHLVEASRLRPADNGYRLNLARVRITSTNPQIRNEGLKALEEMRADSERSLPALRLLLEDAASHNESARVRELVEAMDANPKTALPDKLAQLSAQRAVEDPDFFTKLEQLQAASVHSPADVADLLGWMNECNLAIAATEWAASLPAEITSKPPVSLALADSYSRSSDWKRLKESLDSSSPDRLDFFRLALLSRVLREQHDDKGAGDAWRRALEAAKTRQPWLEGLARLAIARGWQQESEDALWALTTMPACPRWALDALWTGVVKTNDTAQIYRVAKLRFQAAPNELQVRGNYVYLALLTHSSQEDPHPLAEALYKENPGKGAIARIQGLSLYQQGRKEEAVQVMAALPAEELQRPLPALFYGIFLAANGQSDKAREYLQRGQDLPMMPEEKTLMASAQEAMRVAAKSEQTNAAVRGF